MFSEKDEDEYWKRVLTSGVEITQDYINLTKCYCGRHPFLLDVFNNEVYSDIKQNGHNIDQIVDSAINEYSEYGYLVVSDKAKNAQ